MQTEKGKLILREFPAEEVYAGAEGRIRYSCGFRGSGIPLLGGYAGGPCICTLCNGGDGGKSQTGLDDVFHGDRMADFDIYVHDRNDDPCKVMVF